MAKVLTSVPTHQSRDFTWGEGLRKRHGVAELSDFYRRTVAGRVYDDAADNGFLVERNGEHLLFVETTPTYNEENELMCVNFASVCLVNPLTGREMQRIDGVYIHLYND